MGETIRMLKPDEVEELNRFLERAYGHGYNFFRRNSSNIWPEKPEYCLVMENEGRIVGHVGTYPLELKVGSCTIPAGGIGAVAADPEHRGKGYMTRLMQQSIENMKGKGMVLSVLWGNRRRYSHFDYESCGLKYILNFSRSCFERSGTKPVQVREVNPKDPEVLRQVQSMQSTLYARVERKYPANLFGRPKVRVFLGSDGYLISLKETSGDLPVTEVVSPTGKEAELIYGAMNWTFGNSAALEYASLPADALNRLMEAAESWSLVPQGMFRIIDWFGLAKALLPYFSESAEGLAPFELSIGCRWKEESQTVTLSWDGSNFSVSEGRYAEPYVELTARSLAGALLGGPYDTRKLGPFAKILPVN
jgi:predicted N-acetyltransferase YhbS